MNPSNRETAGIPLPPSGEQLASVPADLPAETGSAGAEQAPASEKAPPAPQQTSAGTAGGIIPLPATNPLMTTPGAGSSSPPAANSALAADDDSDLIEKEWVDKAKQIVERTRNDPHKQSEELTVFKADYLKKRYGKTIKVSQ
jgi:hypothetical protein